MAKHRESTFERWQKGQPLNRRQKRDLATRLNSADPGLEIVHRHAAGIDIGKESHFVAVPAGRDEQPVREFGSWTADLERMAPWLKDGGIESVVRPSTGVYGMAVYEVLQRQGFPVNLVDARGTKNLPGRKSDVQECPWLLRLHPYGLLRSCFLPPESIRPLRTAWRLRDRHVKEAGRCVQHRQRALTEMNLQLHNTISDLGGVTGQAIIRAILAGERDPLRLAALRDRRLQASPEALWHSLRGNWKEEALFERRPAVEAYAFYGRQIAEGDRRLQPYLAALPSREFVPEARAAEAPTGSGQPRKREVPRKVVKRKGRAPLRYRIPTAADSGSRCDYD